MKMKLKTDKDLSELSKTLYNIVGERFTVTLEEVGDFIILKSEKALTDEQVNQFLQKSNISLARPVRGDKVSDKSREAYKTAVKNGNWEKCHKILFEILTGEEMA